MMVSVRSYQTNPKAPIPTGWRSEYLWHQVSDKAKPKRPMPFFRGAKRSTTYLEVISKVVPKICARTNSAMFAMRFLLELNCAAEDVVGRGSRRYLWRNLHECFLCL